MLGQTVVQLITALFVFSWETIHPKEISSWLPDLSTTRSRTQPLNIHVWFPSPPVPAGFELKCFAFVYFISSRNGRDLKSIGPNCLCYNNRKSNYDHSNYLSLGFMHLTVVRCPSLVITSWDSTICFLILKLHFIWTTDFQFCFVFDRIFISGHQTLGSLWLQQSWNLWLEEWRNGSGTSLDIGTRIYLSEIKTIFCSVTKLRGFFVAARIIGWFIGCRSWHYNSLQKSLY